MWTLEKIRDECALFVSVIVLVNILFLVFLKNIFFLAHVQVSGKEFDWKQGERVSLKHEKWLHWLGCIVLGMVTLRKINNKALVSFQGKSESWWNNILKLFYAHWEFHDQTQYTP